MPVVAQEEGKVKRIDAKKVGEISGRLGAGRVKKEDTIDNKVGIVLRKKVADEVKKGEVLATIHASSETLANQAVEELKAVYEITKEQVEIPKSILEIIK